MTTLSIPELDEIAETLERGAEAVRRGWCQGTSWEMGYDKDSEKVIPLAVCASGALFHAQGLIDPGVYKQPDNLNRRLRYTLSLISLEGFLGVNDVPRWNDVEGRTQDEVADAMERCAKELRNGTPTARDDRRRGAIRAYETQQHIIDVKRLAE